MPKIISFFVSLIIFSPILMEPNCKEGVKNCNRCDPLTKLCTKCSLDIYTPDEKGGCEPSGKCTMGKNYCRECDSEEKNCDVCETGLYPDLNGGCSFISNCELSYKGNCLKCQQDFILIGGEKEYFKLCKSLNSEDFAKCQNINNITGYCDTCKEGYYLNSGDLKCSRTQNCFESSFGKCSSCNEGYYLDKKNNECVLQTGNFMFCKESLDGEKCDICEDDFYFDQKGNCVGVNFCEEGIYYGCKKCIEGYYSTIDGKGCTEEKHCLNGDLRYGICNSCYGDYYIDLEDRKCKSNKKDNDYKYCKIVENKKCKLCEYGSFPSEDEKCTTNKNCAEVENGICISCSEGYYLGLDNKCSPVEHCIYSENYIECSECEKGYYYNTKDKKCSKFKEGYENCKSTTSTDGDYCSSCKKGFYLNQTNHLCYENNDKKSSFYKCFLTDTTGKNCIGCEQNYYLGWKDKKCSKISGCEKSENEEKCIECDERHCLDVKTGKCASNEKIVDEEQKLYYRCKQTNEEGDACEICLDGFELSENGFCVDTIHCSIKENGICVKCKNNRSYSSCLNSDFGCVPTSYMKCIECDNVLNFDICTKCPQYHKINKKGECIDIDDEDE